MKIKKLQKLINNEMIPVIIYNQIEGDYKIIKNNKNKILDKEFIKINNNIKGKFYKYLYNFSKTLHNNLTHCNLDNFYNNVKEIKIKENYSKFKGFITYASYFVKDNKIVLYNPNYENTLSHELLHMASTKKINSNLILSGFGIIDFDKNEKYGILLNEGYTEYLNGKYFNSANVYKTHIGFVKQLEKIIGENLMEQMYFNADLKGLINELIKYNNTKEEIIEFIVNADTIHKYRNTFTPINKLKLKKACIKVNLFLVKSYYVKLLIDNKKNNEIIKKMVYFMNDLIDISVGFKSNYYYMEESRKFYNNIQEKKLKL